MLTRDMYAEGKEWEWSANSGFEIDKFFQVLAAFLKFVVEVLGVKRPYLTKSEIIELHEKVYDINDENTAPAQVAPVSLISSVLSLRNPLPRYDGKQTSSSKTLHSLSRFGCPGSRRQNLLDQLVWPPTKMLRNVEWKLEEKTVDLVDPTSPSQLAPQATAAFEKVKEQIYLVWAVDIMYFRKSLEKRQLCNA